MDEVQDDCNDDENNADNRGQTSKDTVGCACLAGAVEGVCGAGYGAQTLLCTMLEQTVAEGTAQDASGLPGGAAGKTGTAQTGQFTAEGKERKNLWFAGFYPAEDPQYTIVVLQDGQTQAAVSSAAVFAQLCTALHWLG